MEIEKIINKYSINVRKFIADIRKLIENNVECLEYYHSRFHKYNVELYYKNKKADRIKIVFYNPREYYNKWYKSVDIIYMKKDIMPINVNLYNLVEKLKTRLCYKKPEISKEDEEKSFKNFGK